MDNAVKLLQLLMPPLSVMDALERSNMPDDAKQWWQRCKDIRGDGQSEIDGTSEEVYQEALLVVEEKLSKKAKVY